MCHLSRPGGGGIGQSYRSALAFGEEHSSVTATSSPRPTQVAVALVNQTTAHSLSVRSTARSQPLLSLLSRPGGGGIGQSDLGCSVAFRLLFTHVVATSRHACTSAPLSTQKGGQSALSVRSARRHPQFVCKSVQSAIVPSSLALFCPNPIVLWLTQGFRQSTSRSFHCWRQSS